MNVVLSGVRVLALVFSIAGSVLAAQRSPYLADNGGVGDPNAPAVLVVINEFLASNSGDEYVDPQGEPDDWVELYNPGDSPWDVGGMYMTDDLLVPMKWRMPTGDTALTTIAAHGYLVIWADRDVQDPGLHADFSLSADGEDLALFDTDGETLVDSIHFGRQLPNISYGRFPDGNDSWYLMTIPTPGSENLRTAGGITAKPRFSFEHGFYDREFSVTILCPTEGAVVYYTTDGSEPYSVAAARPGDSASIYTEPVRISATTCLRAAGVRPDWQPSAIATCTYVFLADVVKQSPTGAAPGPGWPTGSINGQTFNYGMDPEVVNDPRYKDLMNDALLAIPSISLVTELSNLFDPRTGIYVNAKKTGQAWERPVSVELIYPDETEGFQVNAGLRIRGGYSRSDSNPKHAYRLFFRSEYGTPKLEYPLFGQEGVDEFENVDLRTSQNYSWAYDGSEKNTFLRDVFSRDTQRDMGEPYSRSRYYHLYLNGQYWGLFQTEERAEASYAESYLGGAKEDYDAIKTVGGNPDYTIEATDGTMDNALLLWEAAVVGFTTDEPYYRIQGLDPNGIRDPAYPKLLDTDNLIDYMLCTFYAGDFDGPISNFIGNNRPNNYHALYNRRNPDGFKWFRHDAEHTLIDRYGWGLDRTGPFTNSDLGRFEYFTPQWLQQKLLEHPEFRMRLADRAHRCFFNDGALTYARSKQRLLDRAQQIEMAIIGESARWGDSKHSPPFTKVHWENEVDRIANDYGDYGLLNRTSVVLNQLKGHEWYPDVVAPVFNLHGGHVPVGFRLEMDAPSDIYYTLDGTDPRLPRKAGSMEGQVLVAENAAKRVLVPGGGISEAWKGGDDFNDASWELAEGSPGGIGYERSSGYELLISFDVGREMYGVATGCYVRIPFEVTADPSQYKSLVLRVRYDDGFVAYINGVEVQRASFTGTPQWNSAAQDSHEGDGPEVFTITERLSLLQQGQNILAIHGLNISSTSSDFLLMVSLAADDGTSGEGSGISPTAIKYTEPVTLDKSVPVKARSLSDNAWSALNETVFAVGPVAEDLRISEILYHPGETGEPNDPNTEFIELTNVGIESVNLNLVKFANGVRFAFPDVVLVPQEYCLVVKDVRAFEARYGLGLPVVGSYAGSLNNAGERIELLDAAGTDIHDFRFEDGWFDITDGPGFSLTIKDPAGADPNAYDDEDLWRPSARAGGSPGADDSGQVPALGAVVISELLANSRGSAPDWIELHNTTDRPISIGGWFLSDDANNLTKYEIAAGTYIAANGYALFAENRHFGSQADPGCHEPFALSASGETLYLHSGSAGVLTGYSQREKFDASEAGVSLGRYQKSTGTDNFVAMSAPTPGAANAAPQVGPVVVNEIMYHPDAPADAEYVELLNISGEPVILYDVDREAPWRFSDDAGIEYLFPADWPVTLAPGEYLLLVKDPELFGSRYTPPADAKVLAWTFGKLVNGMDKIQLSKPGDVSGDGTRQWIRVDRVVYSDGLHGKEFAEGLDPWPVQANGFGASLSRTDSVAYGNDPANWHAAVPSPGSANEQTVIQSPGP
ncbi:MAG: lamin tail domain-containing protein [Sedimentisphaerales bacterium]|nr:lamin tail domain-containing protein [Sedimentisphaerales bacterium]